MDTYYTPTVTTFRPTPEQAAAIRRSGLRVTSLDTTHKVLSRVCKCGRVQEVEIDTEDTPRNRWEAAYAIERLSGDDWRCAVCRYVTAYTPETRGGSGGSGSKAHQDTPRRPRRPRIAKWLQRLAELDALVERIGRLNLTPTEEREYAKLERRWKQSAGKMTAVP